MTDPFAFDIGDPDEPLGLQLSDLTCPEAYPSADAHRFELNSRGDRVPGRLLLPEARSGPCPLILLLGDAGASHDSTTLDFAEPWIRHGFAIATLDLSLHGERSSAKFSERLLDSIASAQQETDLEDSSRENAAVNGRALLLEFTRQSVCDLSRTLDGLISLPAIDAGRIGALGLGHGAAIVAIFASLDPRIKAVALADCRAIRSHEIDPQEFVGRIGPRPVLLMETNPSKAGDALYEACADPRRRGPSCGANGMLSSAAVENAGKFFAERLGTS